MATSTRLSQIQMQDGTSLSGQDLDVAIQSVAKGTQPVPLSGLQRSRTPHRVVRTFTPPVQVLPDPLPFMPIINTIQASLETPTAVFNPYRFHGTEIPNSSPTNGTWGSADAQWALSTRLFFENPAELTRISLSLLTDTDRLATFLWGAVTTRLAGTWIDNLVISVEVQDPFAVDPGSARYQTPIVTKSQFRVSAGDIAPGGTGPETTSPAWPGGGGQMPTGLLIVVATPMSIPAGATVTVAIMLPAGVQKGFGNNYPFVGAETTKTIEWSE